VVFGACQLAGVFSVTLAHIREHGCRSLLVYCGALDCNYSATLNADHLLDATLHPEKNK
jgi:hypothetical protein